MKGFQVKGDLFISVLSQVARRWGSVGVEEVRVRPDEYSEEEWYDFSEFCKLLGEIKSGPGNNNPMSIYELGVSTIKDDMHWQAIFQRLDPVDVFLSTARQERQYKIGAITPTKLGSKHIRLEYSIEADQGLWLEFYRGRLQGVLELTGRTGVVHLLPKETGKPRTFDIKWG